MFDPCRIRLFGFGAALALGLAMGSCGGDACPLTDCGGVCVDTINDRQN